MKRLLGSTAALALFATAAQGTLILHWPMDEGTGSTTAEVVNGGGVPAATLNGGFTWGSDATRSSFVTFDGNEGSFGDPGVDGTVPFYSLASNFTLAFFARRDAADTEPNSIVLGNRFMRGGGDFAPRQFVKVTPTKFEWHMNGNGNDNVEAPDMTPSLWQHHAIVKTGANVDYYQDGLLVGNGTLTQPFTFDQPIFFAGHDQAGGGEFFNGSLDDIRIYDNALSQPEVAALVPEPSTAGLGFLGAALMLLRRKRR